MRSEAGFGTRLGQQCPRRRRRKNRRARIATERRMRGGGTSTVERGRGTRLTLTLCARGNQTPTSNDAMTIRRNVVSAPAIHSDLQAAHSLSLREGSILARPQVCREARGAELGRDGPGGRRLAIVSPLFVTAPSARYVLSPSGGVRPRRMSAEAPNQLSLLASTRVRDQMTMQRVDGFRGETLRLY